MPTPTFPQERPELWLDWTPSGMVLEVTMPPAAITRPDSWDGARIRFVNRHSGRLISMGTITSIDQLPSDEWLMFIRLDVRTFEDQPARIELVPKA